MDPRSGMATTPMSSAIQHDDGTAQFSSQELSQRGVALSDSGVGGPDAKAMRANAAPVAHLVAADSSLSLSTADSWGNPATLADHFARHGADFGATSADEYAAQASQFFQRSQAAGLPTKINSSGFIGPQGKWLGVSADGSWGVGYPSGQFRSIPEGWHVPLLPVLDGSHSEWQRDLTEVRHQAHGRMLH
jgi:hypothetical protein